MCVCLRIGVSPVGGHMDPRHPEPHDLKDDLSNIGQFCYFTVFYDWTSSRTDVLQLCFCDVVRRSLPPHGTESLFFSSDPRALIDTKAKTIDPSAPLDFTH